MVDVVWMNTSGDEVVMVRDLDAGVGYPYDRMGMCLDGTLVARDESGRTIAEANGPFCRPGEVVLGGQPSPSG